MTIISLLFLIEKQYVFEECQAISLRLQLYILSIILLVFLIQPQYVFEQRQTFSLRLPTVYSFNHFPCIRIQTQY